MYLFLDSQRNVYIYNFEYRWFVPRRVCQDFRREVTLKNMQQDNNNESICEICSAHQRITRFIVVCDAGGALRNDRDKIACEI